MNPLERFTLFVAILVLVILAVKSKWFDRAIGSLIQGTKPTTVDDLKADSTRLKTNAQTLQSTLDAQAAEAARAKEALKTL